MNLVSKYLAHKNSQDAVVSILRIFIGLAMALGHGLDKLPPSEMLINAVKSMGFPAPLFFSWCATLAEFGGGLLLAFGLLTRPAAFLILFTMGIAAFGFHGADPYSNREGSLMFFFISMFFLVNGAGRWSLDQLFFKNKAVS